MNKTTSVAPVRKSVTVNCRPSHAFEVFTARMSQWWNPAHSIRRGHRSGRSFSSPVPVGAGLSAAKTAPNAFGER